MSRPPPDRTSIDDELTPQSRRRAIRLELLTVGSNAVEGVVSVVAGISASSIALVGFGLDSFVEVSAALVVLWQFFGIPQDREQRALKLIGASFFLLGAYVTATSVRDLVTRAEPHASTVGIVLTAVSLVVMPILARRSVAPAARSVAARWWPTLNRHSYAHTSRPRHWPDSPPTPRSDGGGPIHWLHWLSPRLPRQKATRPRRVTLAVNPDRHSARTE